MKRILSPRSFFFGLCCLCGILMILFFPGSAAAAAKQAVDTWLRVILPTLLPVSILADLLLQSGTAQKLTSKISRPISRFFGFSPNFCYVFVMSLLSGYPVGARLTAALYEQKQLSNEEAALMLNATSTSGPSFLLMGVGMSMMKSFHAGTILLITHILSAVITAYINGHLPHPRSSEIRFHPQSKSVGTMFLSSVTQSTAGMLIVLGSMVLFSGISAAISELLAILGNEMPLLNAVLSGILEFSTGCKKAAAIDSPITLPLIAFFCGFGSLSVYLQTCAVAAKSNFAGFRLFRSKLLQGSLAAFFTVLLYLPKSPSLLNPLLLSALCSVLSLIFLKNNRRKKKPTVSTVGI